MDSEKGNRVFARGAQCATPLVFGAPKKPGLDRVNDGRYDVLRHSHIDDQHLCIWCFYENTLTRLFLNGFHKTANPRKDIILG